MWKRERWRNDMKEEKQEREEKNTGRKERRT